MSSTAEAEQLLRSCHIPYEKKPDGTIVVNTDLDLLNSGFDKLPDLSQVIVLGNFYCQGMGLTSLQGSPKTVGGAFFGNDNQLTSLQGAPETVGNDFYCNQNPLLTSLEDAPKKFRTLYTDFGNFRSWDKVPEELRTSPETKARLLQERQDRRKKAMAVFTEGLPYNIRTKKLALKLPRTLI